MEKLVLELVPGEGALPLRLGVSREKIGQVMSDLGHDISAQSDTSDYYFRNSIQIEFDEDGLASFIGISSNSEIELIYHGRNILPLPARELFSLINAHEAGQQLDYSPAEHLFPNQIITLWDADEQYNRFGTDFPVWGQVGVGNEGYLAATGGFRV